MNAPASTAYRALLDADAVAKWRVPDGMSGRVHEFDAREGGYFRISLTYDAPTGSGKSTAQTDTYHGHFVKLVPNEQVVEVVEFETVDPDLLGQMTMTATLTAAADGGTDVQVLHEGIPDRIPVADNETGTRMALAGVVALADDLSGAPHGFINPTLYSNTRTHGGLTDVVHANAADVRVDYINGVNAKNGTVTSVRTFDFAGLAISTVPGYDNTTGLGVPNGLRFLRRL